MEKILLKHELTKKEVRFAILILFMKSSRMKKMFIRALFPIAIIVGIIGGITTDVSTAISTATWPTIFILGFMSLGILSIYITAYVVVKRAQKYSMFRIDDWGIMAFNEGDESNEKIAWGDFDYWVEVQGLILLYHSSTEYKVLIISSKVFSSIEGRNDFITLLGDKEIKRK